MKKKKPKKRLFKIGKYLGFASVLIGLIFGGYLLLNKISKNKTSNAEEIKGNILYAGMYESKKVFFIKEEGSIPFYIKGNGINEVLKNIDIKLIKNRKEIYRTEKDILWTNSYLNEDYLFMSLNTENRNILLKLDNKTSKVEELINEEGVAFYSFLIDKIIDKYLIGIYVPLYSNAFKGNRFIINLENNKKIIIDKDNIAGDIKIDKERNKVRWNKVKKEYVNCYTNERNFPNGCDGMYEENRKYFHYVTTDEMVEVSLP